MKPQDFVDGVEATARLYGMDLSRPLVMVSGGPDSVALLRAVLELKGEPVVLHVDHGLRGDGSREDARFVERLCEGLGVRCVVCRLSGLTDANLQEKARETRYRLAEETAEALGLGTIATGHTADDVAETVLLNLSRGAGLAGLSGIPPVRGRVVRPLIRATRHEVLAYLQLLDQPYRTDPTNLVPKYARNRLRLEVLPVLEALHPGAPRNLARAADLAREDLAALESLAATAVEQRGREAVVRLGDLAGMPEALARHAVRLAYSLAAPGEPPPARNLVEAALALTGEGHGTRTLDLPGGVVAAARYGEELAFYREPESGGEEVELLPGEARFGGWELSAKEVEAFDAGDAARAEVAYLDGGKGPYSVRAAREGDMIRPLGLGGRKTVMRALMDRKVPRDRRGRTPVVVDGNGRVAWIFGGEIGEEFAVGKQTEKILRLEVRGSR